MNDIDSDDDPTRLAIAQFAQRAKLIPDSLRNFDVTAEWADSFLGLNAVLIEQTIDDGLPFAWSDAGCQFDRADLLSLSLALRLNSARRSAMRFWVRGWQSLASHDVLRTVQYTKDCPDLGHPGPCDWKVLDPEGVQPPVGGGDPRLRHSVTATIARRFPDAPGELAGILAEYLDVDFYVIPEPLRRSGTFVRRSRIGECEAVTRAIVSDALERGIRARFSFGLICSIPFSTDHCWPEFELAGRWVPYDPFMLNMMKKWYIPGAKEIAHNASPGTMYLRLADDRRPLVTHRGKPCEPSLPTRLAFAVDP